MSEILEIVKKAKESKQRKFKQSFDLAINIKGLDLKKPEGKIKTQASLPHGTGKPAKAGIFADMLISKVKELGDQVILIKKDDIQDLGKNKKKAKKIANTCKFFLAEAPLMPTVGKFLGPVLAVRNKMPKPIPPTLPNIKPLLEKNNKMVDLVLKNTPVIHCPVGTEEMDDQKIVENINAVISALASALPRGKENIKECYLKLTMGKSVKFVI